MTESQPKHRPILKSILQLDAHHRFIVSLGVALACYVSSPAFWTRESTLF